MSKYIAFDAETTGLDVNVNNLLTACFIVLDSDLNELDSLNISLKSENYFINPKAMESVCSYVFITIQLRYQIHFFL